MIHLLKEIAQLLAKGENIVVITLFDKTGSAPRTVGAKMIVRADGMIYGTIGGGLLEAQAMQLAQEVFRRRSPLLQSFDLTGEDVADMDMICGGTGELLIDYIEANESNRMVYGEAWTAEAKREKAWLITALSTGSDRQQCLVKQNGELVGNFHCEADLRNEIVSGPGKLSIHAEVLEGQRYLIEAVRPQKTNYIFGAGHVSQKIAALSATVGFRTVVLDDRQEYANKGRFPDASEIVLLPSFRELPCKDIDEDSFLVIVTRGHLHDKTVLEQCLKTKAGYIGMIGSRRKRDKIFAALAELGFTAADLKRVYSPIGTDILAETPEELAVSIVGELIRVRAETERCTV